MTQFVHLEYSKEHPGVARMTSTAESLGQIRRNFSGVRGLATLLVSALAAAVMGDRVWRGGRRAACGDGGGGDGGGAGRLGRGDDVRPRAARAGVGRQQRDLRVAVQAFDLRPGGLGVGVELAVFVGAQVAADEARARDDA